jgi:tetratricopeptide (TPR) repeat protein
MSRVRRRNSPPPRSLTPLGNAGADPAARWTNLAIVALLLAVVILAFAPALRGEFVDWDDKGNFLENPHYRGLGPTQLRWMFTSFHMGHYQPLSWVTLGLDYVLSQAFSGNGMKPFAYHLTNILFHAGSTALVYLLGLHVLRAAVGRDARRRALIVQASAACAALLFALHPLRVESVAWATERRDVQSSFFLLATVLCYVRAARLGAAHRGRWFALALVAYAFSLLSRAMGVTLPVVLLLLDWYPLGRLGRAAGSPARRPLSLLLLEKTPFILLAAGAAVLAVAAQRHAGATATLAEHGVLSRLAQACFGLVFYVQKTLVPENLSPIYEMKLPLDIASPRYAVPAMLVLAALVGLGLLALCGRARGVVTVLACYAILLLPVLGFVQSGNQLAADRYSYLPSVPLMLLLAAGLARVGQASSAPSRGRLLGLGSLVGAACLTLAILTWRQCGVWRSTGTLWTYAVRVCPESSIAVNSHGWVLWREQGRADEALAAFRRAIQLQPANEQAHKNIWVVYRERGSTDELIQAYRDSIRIFPTLVDAHIGLANALLRRGENTAAIDSYRDALRLSPGNADARINLAIALNRRGEPAEARREYEQVLQADPRNAPARHGLAGILKQQQQDAEALAQLRLAVAADPNYAPARRLLEQWTAPPAASAPTPP